MTEPHGPHGAPGPDAMHGPDGVHGPRRAVPAAGADAAITTGRRRLRRRRTAAATAGASLAAFAVLALAGGDGRTGRTGLRPAGTDPLPTALPAVTATPLPTAHPTPTGTPPPPPEETPEPEETAGPEQPGDPGAEPTAAPDRQWVGHTHGNYTFRRGDPEPSTCPTAPGAPANGFCTFALGPRTVSRGERARLTLKLCRATSASETRIAYPDMGDVRVWVTRQDDAARDEAEVWRWRNTGDPSASVQPYRPGECETWTVNWRGQGSDGYALPPGDYQVNVDVPPADWGRPPPPPAFYPVTVR